MEAGYRCAIPTCRQHPVQIAHIVPWSKVRVHEYTNLIALCGVCHARFDRGEIDRKAMLQYKANLGIVNARYGEYERRLLEFYAARWKESLRMHVEEHGVSVFAEHTSADAPSDEDADWLAPIFVSLPAGLEFLMSKLILDGCLRKVPRQEIGLTFSGSAGSVYEMAPVVETYALTSLGMQLVMRIIRAEPLELLTGRAAWTKRQTVNALLTTAADTSGRPGTPRCPQHVVWPAQADCGGLVWARKSF
jgi:hypothetical protein